jgi:hypothetical protein
MTWCFEYFLTDHAGHSRSMEEAAKVLRSLTACSRILGSLAAGMLLLVISDHGNMEDLSVKTHTESVPLAAARPSPACGTLHPELTDLAPAIGELLCSSCTTGGAYEPSGGEDINSPSLRHGRHGISVSPSLSRRLRPSCWLLPCSFAGRIPNAVFFLLLTALGGEDDTDLTGTDPIPSNGS